MTEAVYDAVGNCLGFVEKTRNGWIGSVYLSGDMRDARTEERLNSKREANQWVRDNGTRIRRNGDKDV